MEGDEYESTFAPAIGRLGDATRKSECLQRESCEAMMETTSRAQLLVNGDARRKAASARFKLLGLGK